MRFMLVSNLVKPCIYFKWLLESNQCAEAGKGHIVLFDQTTKGTLEVQRSQCPSVRGLTLTRTLDCEAVMLYW